MNSPYLASRYHLLRGLFNSRAASSGLANVIAGRGGGLVCGVEGCWSTAPKPEAPKPEAPKPEAPKPEAPKPEAPKPEAPKPEVFVTNTPIKSSVAITS